MCNGALKMVAIDWVLSITRVACRKFYDLLGVPETASESELKKAYRQKSVYDLIKRTLRSFSC